MNRLFTIFFALLMTSATVAQAQKTEDRKELEMNVREDVETRLDDNYEVTEVMFEDNFIMVQATDGEVIKRSYYTPVGEFNETITEASYSALPKGAREALNMSNFSHADIQEVFFVEMLTEEFFALKVLRQGEVRYVFIDSEGKELKKTKKLLFMTEV